MTFTSALAVAVVVVVATLGTQIDVLASSPSFKIPRLNAQKSEGVVECSKLFEKRHVATKSGSEVIRKGPLKGSLKPGPRDLEASILFAKDTVARMSRLEANLEGAGVTVPHGTPSHSLLIDSYPGSNALAKGRDALIAVKASQHLAHSHCRRFGLNKDRCAKYISTLNLKTTSLGTKCSSPELSTDRCAKSYKYRSLDGSCNHPLLPRVDAGAAHSGYRRLIVPEYGDSMLLPREDFKGRPLPSARLISSRLSNVGYNLGEDKTLALVEWARFVEHDMTHTPTSKMSKSEKSIMCCTANGSVLKPRHLHPSCLPVHVPDNDPVYAKEHVRCINYVRSVPAMRNDCTFGPLEQMNQATHFLDGSMIYGTTSEKALSLRQFIQGKLIDSSKGGRRFLPSVEKPTEECLVNSDATTCYKSGDVRVNSHPQLTLMYTLWHREHNRVADALASMNPQWDDETVYQEARRVVTAQIQHITFNEWIPLVLGEKFSKKQGLKLPINGFTNKYDEQMDPTVSNSFSTCAMRYVHSMAARPGGANVTTPIDVDVDVGVDGLIRDLLSQEAPKSNAASRKDPTASYPDTPWRLDPMALDIQRGRDHGLPGYNKYRKICGLPAAKNFHQFEDVIPKSVVDELRRVYSHPDDVDLLVGGLSEQPAPDSSLGHTFRCILGEQFARTFKGDRFFYDLRNQPHSFTPEQLRSLKKVSLARILCDNGDDMVSIQPDVFSKPSPSNELALCREVTRIPRLNLDLWKTTQASSI